MQTPGLLTPFLLSPAARLHSRAAWVCGLGCGHGCVRGARLPSRGSVLGCVHGWEIA